MTQENGKRAIEPEVHYPEQINAHYSNRVQLFLSNSDVIFDFTMLEPTATGKTPKVIFQSRIIMSPQHAKQLSTILSENMAKYEEMFGTINLAPIKK